MSKILKANFEDIEIALNRNNFEDIVVALNKNNNNDIMEVIVNIQMKELLLAMKNASDEVKEAFFYKMTKGMVESLKS